MPGPVPVRPHGTGVRGRDLSRSSPLFGGPFGRIFRALPPADFGNDDPASVAALTALASKMVADADPVIAHLAFRALRDLKASQVCLAALDSADEVGLILRFHAS